MRSRMGRRVSIHAPRAGGDPGCSESLAEQKFQSTPPARGATLRKEPKVAQHKFQSTPPARGATPDSLGNWISCRFQSTPPARGATAHLGADVFGTWVSIHAPRAGGDPSP